MPVVTVQLWSGRTTEQKRRLVRAMTDAIVEHAGCRPDHLHVIIQDVPKDSWGRAGVLGIDEAQASASDRKQANESAEPRALGFAHMLLKVADIDSSTRFYRDLLGFTERQAKPLADGRPFAPFHQGLALTSGRPVGAPQIDHMAFRVNDVRGLAERLRNAEAEFVQDLHDGIYGLTIYVRDPDGNTVELYQEGANSA